MSVNSLHTEDTSYALTKIIVGTDGVEVDWQVLVKQSTCPLAVELWTGCLYPLVRKDVYWRVCVLFQRLLELEVA
jgi:hypothetical protein